MTLHSLQKIPYKDVLPQGFLWLDKVPLNYCDGLVANSHHILMVTENKTTKEWLVDAPSLSANVLEGIKKAATLIGWKGQGGPQTIRYDDASITLVPQSSLEIAEVRKGRQIGLDLATYLKKMKLDQLVIGSGEKVKATSILEGFFQGSYQVQYFKSDTDKDPHLVEKISLLDTHKDTTQLQNIRTMAKALFLTRMIEDSPPNWLTSVTFAEIVTDVMKPLSTVKTKVMGREEILAMGMGSFHSVAKGTSVDPKFIVMEIQGKDPKKSIALVGKGLTFDSGGICLKPAAGMADMKYDMCGGAAVFGSAYYLAHVTPPTNVVCLIGAVENMPGYEATRPGDIVKAMNGKTIEILNTDAEGRLVLADLLHYASVTYKPEFMIDIATLTGAVLMALGSCGSALLSNNQKIADYVLSRSQDAGEPLWQLPLWPELAKEVKSEIADLKNIAKDNVKAGSIIAAVFLREFVGDTPWVHLDIAGTGWDCKATGHPMSGGSGFGLRTMVQSCLRYG